MDTRALRGGPALRLSAFSTIAAGLGSDSSRRVTVTFNLTRELANAGDTDAWRTRLRLGMRPSRRLLLSADGGYTRATDDLQYVATAQASDGPRWVMGRIDQEVWSVTFRANLTLTPELTVQYYGSPFIATGKYADFKKATQTLAPVYEDRFHRYAESEIGRGPRDNVYRVTEAGGAPATYSFVNPDFNFTQFRSNLVVRWEYKPGSSLFVVWSQGRTGDAASPTETFSQGWSELWRARSDNVVLVKATYWFSL